ncbi:MAG: hypothetical protein U1E76_02405 [Planctomycetota bacterium]
MSGGRASCSARHAPTRGALRRHPRRPGTLPHLREQAARLRKEQLEDRDIDEQQHIDVALLPRDTHIAGHVHTEAGHAVPGARLTTEEVPEQVTRCDAQGAFVLEGVAAKAYRLRVEHEQLAAKGYVYYPIAGGREDVLLILADDAAARDEVAHPPQADALIGKPAPPLDLRIALPAGDVALEARVSVLHFFQSYNAASTRHLGELEAAARVDGFAFIPIHHAGAEERGLTEWLRGRLTGTRVAIDRPDRDAPLGSRTFARYGVTRMPTDVVIDAQGNVAAVLAAKASVAEVVAAVQRARH